MKDPSDEARCAVDLYNVPITTPLLRSEAFSRCRPVRIRSDYMRVRAVFPCSWYRGSRRGSEHEELHQVSSPFSLFLVPIGNDESPDVERCSY